MNSTDQVTIPAGPLQIPTINLVHNSALTFCTEVATHRDGRITVTRSWPTLSTGEAVLWSLLESITSGPLFAAFDKLDLHNLAVLHEALAAVTAPAMTETTS